MARQGNGTSSYLSNASYASLAGNGGPFTVAFWFKPANLTQTNTYLMAGVQAVGGGSQWAVIWEFVNNTIEFFSSGHTGTNPRTGSGIVLSDTNWHHIAYRKAAAGASAWDYFLDGAKTQISASITFTLQATIAQFSILAVIGGAGTPTAFVAADMSDVVICPTALSDATIAALAKSYSPKFFYSEIGSSGRHWELFGNSSPEPEFINGTTLTLNSSPAKAQHPPMIYPARARLVVPAAASSGRIMGGLAGLGGLAGSGGLAGIGGGLAG